MRDFSEDFSLDLLLESNGWLEIEKTDPLYTEHDDVRWYKQRLLIEYYVDVYAAVSEEKITHGIRWIEVRHEYHNNGSFSINDLDEMREAMERAEEILLKLEIPFDDDYEFMNDENKEKQKRNLQLREKYHLKEQIEKYKKMCEEDRNNKEELEGWF